MPHLAPRATLAPTSVLACPSSIPSAASKPLDRGPPPIDTVSGAGAIFHSLNDESHFKICIRSVVPEWPPWSLSVAFIMEPACRSWLVEIVHAFNSFTRSVSDLQRAGGNGHGAAHGIAMAGDRGAVRGTTQQPSVRM